MLHTLNSIFKKMQLKLLFDLDKNLSFLLFHLQPKKVKNVKKDVFGSTHGRIHMERQDYSRLQTRKMKGLKKRRFEKKKDEENASSEPDLKKIKKEEILSE